MLSILGQLLKAVHLVLTDILPGSRFLSSLSMGSEIFMAQGLLTGRIFDLGYFRASLIGSTILYILSNFLIASSKFGGNSWKVEHRSTMLNANSPAAVERDNISSKLDWVC